MLVIKLCPGLVTTWTVAHQAPLSIEFSRQEYWNGLPFPSPGGLLDPGTKAHKPPVVLRAVPSHNNIWLEISLPLNPVRCGGSPPLGKVCGCVAFRPDMVPGTQAEKPLVEGREAEVSKCWSGG